MFDSTVEIKNAAMDHALRLHRFNAINKSTDQLVESAQKIFEWMTNDS